MGNSFREFLQPRTRGGDRGRYYLLQEGETDLAQIYFRLVSVITVISLYLDFKGYSAVPD